MATTSKALFRGAASTGSTTLYTVPSATTAIVTNIAVTNTASSSATFTIKLDGVDVISGPAIDAKTTVIFDMKQPLSVGDLIEGSASATTVNFHIAGIEVS